ncbi:MAG: DUF2330 domain-containing protein [Myxococcales bacterium]|nr:DUF2330 domain-containing protein [Myxococcales bacterium]
MKSMHKWMVAMGVATTAMAWHVAPAEACGGCFVPPEESTVVTGHRMVLSVGMDQSTLYDQIEYSGDPADFAWVLPIRGQVDIGVSSDLVFNQLGFDTGVQVAPPPQDCPVYTCNDRNAEDASFGATGAGGASGEGGVNVIAQEVVGPYETVQLEATDPNALYDWLASHGYSIPAEIEPIIDDYLAEGFNFLAMKLVPGVGIDRMAPVRITTPGAQAALPLRMVAAGTGAFTTVSLWVIGEGRYQPQNFPAFEIPAEGVIWNYDSNDSNYTELRQQAYDASNNYGWLVESSIQYYPDAFRSQILNVVDFNGPEQSGYDDGTGDWQAAYDAANEDMDVLFAGMNAADVKVTRLRAELGRPALAKDLVVEAADDQSDVSPFIQTTKWVGSQPACPPPPACYDGSGSGDGPIGERLGSGDGCAVSEDDGFDDSSLVSALLVGLGLAATRRRRRRR